MPDGSERGNGHLIPFLNPPSTVHIELAERTSDDGETRTTITIAHDGLPVEWLDDLKQYWRWRLTASAKVYNLGHY